MEITILEFKQVHVGSEQEFFAAFVEQREPYLQTESQQTRRSGSYFMGSPRMPLYG